MWGLFSLTFGGGVASTVVGLSCTLGGGVVLTVFILSGMFIGGVIYGVYEVSFCVFVAFLKISDSCSSAISCSAPMSWNGMAGCRFLSALLNFSAECAAMSCDDIVGMLTYAGKNSTVSPIRSLLKDGRYTR